MTHEANLSEKMTEDEWQLYCEEVARDANVAEDGKGPDGQDEESDPPQA
jgi:hypothetical protein